MSGSQSGGSERDVLLFMRDSQSALSKKLSEHSIEVPPEVPLWPKYDVPGPPKYAQRTRHVPAKN